MEWVEYKAIKYFHVDISTNSTVLISSPSGLLTFLNESSGQIQTTKISFDMNCKKVRFYPDGDNLFTSSDNDDGLRVWDTEKQEIIFSYPKEIIYDHIYVHGRNIAAITDIGIRFYDLRMRYSSRFHQKKNIRKLDFSNDELFFSTDHDICRLEYKNEILVHHSDKKIIDFYNNVCLTSDSLYFIKYDIEKQHKATKLVPFGLNTGDRKVIISSIHENVINQVEMDKDSFQKMEFCQKIAYAIDDTHISCIFADNKVFIKLNY